MANTKISQFPEYTGNTYNGYVIWNDSGETTTFKTKYNIPIKQVGTSILPSSSTNIVDNCVLIGESTLDNDFRFSSIAIGNGNQIRGPRVVGIGTNLVQLVDDCVLIGNNAGGTGNGGIVSIGSGALGGGNYGISIGVGNIIPSGDRTLSIGAQSITQGAYSINIGADNNINCERGIMIGAQQSLSSPYSTLLNGISNTLSSTGRHNNIFNGSGNTISGSLSGVSIISCFDVSATTDNTTYVDNLRILGQTNFGTYDNLGSTATYTIDWGNGNIQKILLTGATTFSATSILDGTTYIIKVQQDATGSRTATWDSSIFKFPNSTPPTLSTAANAVDILTFVAIDNLLYGVAQLNFG